MRNIAIITIILAFMGLGIVCMTSCGTPFARVAAELFTSAFGIDVFEDNATAPQEWLDTLDSYTSKVLQGQDLDKSILKELNVVVSELANGFLPPNGIKIESEDIFVEFGKAYNEFVKHNIPLSEDQQELLLEHIGRANNAFSGGNPNAKCCHGR